MKIRKGFVSNSSSSSFIVYKKGIDLEKVNFSQYKEHFKKRKINNYDFFGDTENHTDHADRHFSDDGRCSSSPCESQKKSSEGAAEAGCPGGS